MVTTCRTASQIESARYRHLEKMGNVVKNIYSHVLRAKVLRRYSQEGASIKCRAERVDDARSEQICVAQRHGLNQIVGARQGRSQCVLRDAVRNFLVELGAQIAHEHGVRGFDLIVHLPYAEEFVGTDGTAVVDLPALIGRGRKELAYIDCRDTELRRRDAVAHKRGPQDDLPAGVAGGQRDGGKVAAQHRLGGNERDRVGRGLARIGPLKTSKEKQFVFLDRSADGSAPLIPLQAVLGGREEVAGVQGVVAYEFEQGAVPLVGAGLGHRSDRPAGVVSVLGRQRPAHAGGPLIMKFTIQREYVPCGETARYGTAADIGISLPVASWCG